MYLFDHVHMLLMYISTYYTVSHPYFDAPPPFPPHEKKSVELKASLWISAVCYKVV